MVLQFDDIRRVLRQEAPLLARARGLMGNAQQPIMALPNLYLFARAAQHPEYLERTDTEVLRDLAEFVGGEADLLAPAWDCLRLDLDSLRAGLPQRLRSSELTSKVAACLPGGAARVTSEYREHLSRRDSVCCRAANCPPMRRRDAMDWRP